ncbi:hypothetical protein [Salmonirosea aquatica]|uniref:Uncharacterized protein n=1 Tax=Salmonirosea aquatica TaxID=2654236 RepID=A0A7C9BQU2_9BACT|nr:hypothetical protein [Cytophagaceae bacterium SJW1-29]
MKIKTTLYPFHLILLALAIGCSKKDDVVDPRDQFVGTYNVTVTEGPPMMRTLKTTIKFSKSQYSDQLILSDFLSLNPT